MTYRWRKRTALRTRLPALLLAGSCLSGVQAAMPGDTHHNDAGFFDIHVCNWPGRPTFFMPLFSTARFNEVQSIEILTPSGELLVELDLERYRTIKGKKKADKRVFIRELDVLPAAENGWYTARTKLANGEEHVAKDYVILHTLPQVSGQVPAHNEEVIGIPEKLSWDEVPGANFYQVFIRNLWDDSKLIHTSKLLTRPELELPPGLLQHGGYYSWVVHARDTNSHILLGDFNHGSLNKPVSFSVQ